MNEASELQPPQSGAGETEDTENKELTSSSGSADRHSRKCQICRHPEREAIEEQFAHWIRPTGIARFYNVPRVALYRHARALDLFALRRNNMRCALDQILERGAEKPISGNTIIRAVKAHACLTDDNRWIEPPRRLIVIHEHEEVSPKNAEKEPAEAPNSNRYTERLENGPSL